MRPSLRPTTESWEGKGQSNGEKNRILSSSWPSWLAMLSMCRASLGQHYTNGNKGFERVSKPNICMQEEETWSQKLKDATNMLHINFGTHQHQVGVLPDNGAVLRSLMLKLLQDNVTCIMWGRMTQGGLWLLRDVRKKLLAPSWPPTPLISESKSGQN